MDEAPSRSAACVELDRSLKAALDDTRAQSPSPESVLAVRNPECGTSVYVSADEAVSPEMRTYRIGSVTKTYVSSVILKLVADGKLGLDASIATWLPSIPAADQITVRQLLSHRSGLFNYTDDDAFRKASPGQVFSPEDLLAMATSHPAYFAPGASFYYSNTNYIALGIVAEQVGGAKLSALIRTRLLSPAALALTYLDGQEPAVGVLASGYDRNGNDVTTVLDPSASWAAGAMVASPSDLVEWITRLGSGLVHDAAMQAELVKGMATGSPGLSYGLGVFLLQPSITGGGGLGIGHAGDIPGYHTQAFYFPDHQTTVAVIVTSDGADANAISMAALGTLFAAH